MRKILIIDDDKTLANSTKEFLTLADYSVEVANNGPDGLDMARKDNFDVIILDYQMRPMDGLTVLKHIKEENLPSSVILFTAYGNFDVVSKALSLGAHTVLPKPINMDRLKNVIRNAMRERSYASPLQVGQSENLNDKSKIDVGKANILIVDDSRMFRKMIIMALSSEFKDFNFIEAIDGTDAINKMNEYEIKLIFLDINMPQMSGLEFMKLKKKSPKFERIPIVVLTTEKEKQTMAESYLSGATVFMQKPFQPPELVKVVKTLIYWHVK